MNKNRTMSDRASLPAYQGRFEDVFIAYIASKENAVCTFYLKSDAGEVLGSVEARVTRLNGRDTLEIRSSNGKIYYTSFSHFRGEVDRALNGGKVDEFNTYMRIVSSDGRTTLQDIINDAPPREKARGYLLAYYLDRRDQYDGKAITRNANQLVDQMISAAAKNNGIYSQSIAEYILNGYKIA